MKNTARTKIDITQDKLLDVCSQLVDLSIDILDCGLDKEAEDLLDKELQILDIFDRLTRAVVESYK